MKRAAVHWLCPVSGKGPELEPEQWGTIVVGPSPCSGVLHKTIQPILPGPGPGPCPEHNKCN